MNDIYKTPESDLAFESQEVNYAGFWIRVGASIIDTIWLLLLTLSLGWMIYGAIYFESTELSMGFADIIITYLLPLFLTVMFWIYKSATPGKMMLGLKIVDATTLKKASGGRLFLRYIGYYVSTIVLFLGFLWVIWDSRKQGWHDKMANTVVIKTK